MEWETEHKDPGLNNISSTRDQFKKMTKTAWLSCNYVIQQFQCSFVYSKEVCLILLLNIKGLIKTCNFYYILYFKILHLLFYPRISMKYFAFFIGQKVL